MRNFIVSLWLFILTSPLTSIVLAQGNKHKWDKRQESGYTYSYVTNDPTETRFYTLKNGLTVILSPDKRQPRIQTYIATKAGSKTDPEDHTGLAHYLEHLLFKGTDRIGTQDWAKEKPLLDQIDGLYERYNQSSDEKERSSIYRRIDSVSGEAAKFAIANEYDKIMTSLGAQGTNAFTSFEQTVYIEDIPNNVMEKYLAIQAERFRNPIFRLFHTELEAVYEEKNMELDDDSKKMVNAIFETMFKKHNYGKQTVLGSVEHLKNPSLTAIRKYYHDYYVPNNMGVIMSGDFDPNTLIKQIDNAFSFMQKRPVEPYKFDQEDVISNPITKEVFGPNPEFLMLAYRFPGVYHQDAKMLKLLGSILSNGSAGIIDLNINIAQTLLGAAAYPYILKDHSLLVLEGHPLEGQSLDEAKQILMAELEKLKKGEFSDELIKAIINNERKAQIKRLESYKNRAEDLMFGFTTEIDWSDELNYTEWVSQVTKEDIVAFANKYIGSSNYATIYKKQGIDKSIVKVNKPIITPISVNRVDQSMFFKTIQEIPEATIKPVWIDYNKSVQKEKIGDTDVLSVKNNDNDLFEFSYRFDIGNWNNKLLGLAAGYLDYVGTNEETSEELSKKLYSLASDFKISVDNEETTITVTGLNENFEKTITVLHDILKNCVADNEAFAAYMDRVKKTRTNYKENKDAIVEGLRAYAKYGAKNPFNYTFSDIELNKIKAQDLIQVIHDLSNTRHEMLYYGPRSSKDITSRISSLKSKGIQYIDLAQTSQQFKELITDKKGVLFVNYKMNQVDVYWQRNAGIFNKELTPLVALFNSYFGGGMGSIVFQTLRESKALAYTTYAGFMQPSKANRHYSITAYIGTQADKFVEATEGMQELLTTLPKSDILLETAKVNLIKSLASERMNGSAILNAYLAAKKLGSQDDIRKSIFDKASTWKYQDLAAFHKKEFSDKNYIYCIVGEEENLDMEELKKLGSFKQLTLEEIFGY